MFELYINWENPYKIERGGGRGSSYLVRIQDSEFSRNFGPHPLVALGHRAKLVTNGQVVNGQLVYGICTLVTRLISANLFFILSWSSAQLQIIRAISEMQGFLNHPTKVTLKPKKLFIISSFKPSNVVFRMKLKYECCNFKIKHPEGLFRPIMKMTGLENGLVMGSADCMYYAGLVKTPEKLF